MLQAVDIQQTPSIDIRRYWLGFFLRNLRATKIMTPMASLPIAVPSRRRAIAFSSSTAPYSGGPRGDVQHGSSVLRGALRTPYRSEEHCGVLEEFYRVTGGVAVNMLLTNTSLDQRSPLIGCLFTRRLLTRRLIKVHC